MALEDMVALARALWPAWLMLLFLGIVAWVFRPKAKRGLEAHADIPLRDGDEER
jgi:cbb3-type cytochrome oxidase subunit 3